MSLLGRMLRRKQPTETLRENALRFVDTVNDLAHDQRYIQMYPHSGYHGRRTRAHGWIAMPNHEWRNLVIERLRYAGYVGEFHFTPPDALDGWTFSAVSIVPTPRVALLGLEDRI